MQLNISIKSTNYCFSLYEISKNKKNLSSKKYFIDAEILFQLWFRLIFDISMKLKIQ